MGAAVRTPVVAKQRAVSFIDSMALKVEHDEKWQTRRLLALQPRGASPDIINCHALDRGGFGFFDDFHEYKCPYGAIGDLLWVRQAWGIVEDIGFDGTSSKRPMKAVSELSYGDRLYTGAIIYRTDGHYSWDHPTPNQGKPGWKPARFMPKAASRTLLQITDIRAERLQCISESDAIAEGCDNSKCEAAISTGWYERPVKAFERLWIQTYGQESWTSNNYVWVISFKKINKKEAV